MASVPAGFAPAQFSSAYLNHIGPFYEGTRDGELIVGLLLAEQHINFREIAHGGVLTTLADVGMSWKIICREDPRPGIATMSMTTDFLGPGKLGDWLEAHVTVDRMGKETAFAHGQILLDGAPVLNMSGVYRLYR